MDRERAEERLRDYLLHGLVTELYYAEEAHALASEIGRHADRINEAGFGQLFGSLQHTLSDRQTLSVAKLFEEPWRQYRLRSIPAILSLLEEAAPVLVVRERPTLTRVLNGDGEESAGLADSDLTIGLTRHYRAQLADPEHVAAWTRLRDSRDKVIAHNEDVDASVRVYPTWGDAVRLVAFAAEFTRTVAWAYLSLELSVGGEFRPSADARQTAHTLARLLRGAGLDASAA